MLIGNDITKIEFEEFLDAQIEDNRLRFCLVGDDLFWSCTNESDIHHQGRFFFGDLARDYNRDNGIPARITFTGNIRQTNRSGYE